MTCYVSSGTLNSTHSLTPCVDCLCGGCALYFGVIRSTLVVIQPCLCMSLNNKCKTFSFCLFCYILNSFITLYVVSYCSENGPVLYTLLAQNWLAGIR